MRISRAPADARGCGCGGGGGCGCGCVCCPVGASDSAAVATAAVSAPWPASAPSPANGREADCAANAAAMQSGSRAERNPATSPADDAWFTAALSQALAVRQGVAQLSIPLAPIRCAAARPPSPGGGCGGVACAIATSRRVLVRGCCRSLAQPSASKPSYRAVKSAPPLRSNSTLPALPCIAAAISGTMPRPLGLSMSAFAAKRAPTHTS